VEGLRKGKFKGNIDEEEVDTPLDYCKFGKKKQNDKLFFWSGEKAQVRVQWGSTERDGVGWGGSDPFVRRSYEVTVTGQNNEVLTDQRGNQVKGRVGTMLGKVDGSRPNTG